MSRRIGRNLEEEHVLATIEKRAEKRAEMSLCPENIRIVLDEAEADLVRPVLQEFAESGIYGQEEVAGDEIKVSSLEREFREKTEALSVKERKEEERRRNYARALEFMVIKGGDTGAWFGQDGRVIPTAKFDDLKNETDAVYESETTSDKESVVRMALAIDVCGASEVKKVREKMNRNHEHLEGVLEPLEVKYFDSPITGFKGKLKGLIPVVVGVDQESTEKLANFFADLIEAENASSEDYEKKMTELKKHPVQKVFLEEIRTQLIYYVESNRVKEQYKREIEVLLDKIERVIEEKAYVGENNKIDFEGFGRDRVFSAIKDFTQSPAKRKVA